MASQLEVKLHIYDLSRGIAKQMSPLLLGKQINGIWHTGIVVYGKEYFFGSGGIEYCPPCGTILGEPDEIQNMGPTQIPEDVFQDFLIGLSEKDFKPECYNLFEHNCNTFSNEAGQFLTGRTIPNYIQELPKDVLNTPFGAMIKPIFDSMSVRPNAKNAMTFPATENGTTDPETIFEPRPTTSRNNSDSFISESPKVQLQQSKDIPIVYNNYKVSSLISSLEQTIEKGDLTENDVCRMKEIEKVLMSEHGDKVSKSHLQLLETLLERYELSDEVVVLTNIVQTLGVLVLQDDIISMVCQDPVSKPVFKLAREFPKLKSPEVQCAVVELFTNICSTDAGREIFVAENEGPGASGVLNGSSLDKSKISVEHHETVVDHRDVIEVTVTAMLDGNSLLLEKAAGLVYNISMAKVSEESALECSSAILECLHRDELETNTVYHCLFALKNFMKISPEIVNLSSLIGIELSKFLKLSQSIQEVCNELEQYLVV